MKKSIIVSILSISYLSILSLPAYANRYYGSYLCGYPGFKCVNVLRGQTWERLFPNYRDREIVKRLNRTNMPLQYRSWIVVPTNLHEVNNLQLSPFPLQYETNGKKLLLVSLSKQAFGAYDSNGELIHWGPISGGKDYCPDIGGSCSTATGHFKVYRKQGPDCISTKFPIDTEGGAPMPYCMHYNGGFAIHGSTLPGYHASHGCIRVFTDDAQWLNEHFTNIGTPVIVSD